MAINRGQAYIETERFTDQAAGAKETVTIGRDGTGAVVLERFVDGKVVESRPATAREADALARQARTDALTAARARMAGTPSLIDVVAYIKARDGIA